MQGGRLCKKTAKNNSGLSPKTPENAPMKGLDQLLNRYTTGRDRSGYVFDYFREENIKAKMLGIRAAVDTSLPCLQMKPAEDHPATWAFVTHHTHSSGETVRVVHFGVNLAI
jgi:hypothetical protein